MDQLFLIHNFENGTKSHSVGWLTKQNTLLFYHLSCVIYTVF